MTVAVRNLKHSFRIRDSSFCREPVDTTSYGRDILPSTSASSLRGRDMHAWNRAVLNNIALDEAVKSLRKEWSQDAVGTGLTSPCATNTPC
jgi:hypothetical protein